MPELGWREAAISVLKESSQAMHYSDIAEEITARGLKSNVGATPSGSVNVAINLSIKNDAQRSPFIRVSPGYYWLREKAGSEVQVSLGQRVVGNEPNNEDGAGLINAFGMYWARDQILWSTSPRLLGKQLTASKAVDFNPQIGVYLLHDGRSVVYVGRTTEQPMGLRLRQHTVDRLNSRWNRFSWFGIYAVDEATGALDTNAKLQFDVTSLIATMEALLIEGLEPPQNRKRGDDFRAVEFLQVQDPDLERNEILMLMESLKQKL